MNSTGIKVRELNEIITLLERNKCPHYKYDDVLEYLKAVLAPLPLIISFREELALEKMQELLTLEELLLGVFSVENTTAEVVQCNGCYYALLIREVLTRSSFLGVIGVISDLCTTLISREFES